MHACDAQDGCLCRASCRLQGAQGVRGTQVEKPTRRCVASAVLGSTRAQPCTGHAKWPALLATGTRLESHDACSTKESLSVLSTSEALASMGPV